MSCTWQKPDTKRQLTLLKWLRKEILCLNSLFLSSPQRYSRKLINPELIIFPIKKFKFYLKVYQRQASSSRFSWPKCILKWERQIVNVLTHTNKSQESLPKIKHNI